MDHLAAVDAMTRATSHNKPLLRWAGVLFSFGQGSVVIIFSLIIGGYLFQFQTPEWLDGVGKWISVIFLLSLGVLNLVNIFLKQNSKGVVLLSVRSLLSKKVIQKKQGSVLIVLIGALFALSFDTFSQIALFSISASSIAP